MKIETLYQTLNQRKRPEDIAEMIIDLLGANLTSRERLTLEKAAKRSLNRTIWGYSSMLQKFSEPIGAEKQIKKAIEIFNLGSRDNIQYNDLSSIESFIKEVSPIIQKPFGGNNFKTDRLTKSQRADLGLDISKRNYNKKWRIMKRLEKKLHKFAREGKKIEFQKISKHGIAHRLDLDNFSKDLNSACFIAYFNARSNLRSVFTNQKQERAFDDISEMLLNRCKGLRKSFFGRNIKDQADSPNTTNWWAISHIYTSQEVLANLSDEQKGKLLGIWTTILREIASLLDEIWQDSDINRQTMVVKRGNDSTTWNNTVGAWNKARDNWMNLIYSMGMDYVLDELCFGKAMRLMAADVVAWHHMSGGKIDPNTDVWNKLPLPWEVFEGKMKCNKKLVEQLCTDAGIDAEKSGWIAPRVHGVAEFKPTPELVHGVEVYDPFLATVLKKNRYFSGKNVKPIAPENN